MSVWRRAGGKLCLTPLNFVSRSENAMMHKLIIICMQLEVILIFIIQHYIAEKIPLDAAAVNNSLLPTVAFSDSVT